LQAAGGLLAILIGSYVTLYIYAFVSMIPPGLVGWDRTQRLHERLFLSLNVIPLAVGILAVFAGIAMIVIACCSAFGKEPSKIILAGITGLLAIVGVLLAIAALFC
jgi:hypothetical protein